MTGHGIARAGWLVALFIAAPASAPAADPGGNAPAFAARFLAGDGHEERPLTEIDAALAGTLDTDAGTVFRPGSELRAMVKGLLALDALAGHLPHVRYRLRMEVRAVAMPPAADPVPVSYLEIARFNLGPRVHAALVDTHGRDTVAPRATFGTGPHLSWRFVMRPETGVRALLAGASRRVIDDTEAARRTCLETSCLSPRPAIAPAAPWSEARRVDRLADAAYPVLHDDLPTPAAAIETLTADTRLDPRPAGRGWSPTIDAFVERGLGQDNTLEATLVEGGLADGAVRARWDRLMALPGGTDHPPTLFTAQALECHRGADRFAAPGALCP